MTVGPTACMSAVDPESSTQSGSALPFKSLRTCGCANVSFREVRVQVKERKHAGQKFDLFELFIFGCHCQLQSDFCAGTNFDFAVFRYSVVFALLLLAHAFIIAGQIKRNVFNSEWSRAVIMPGKLDSNNASNGYAGALVGGSHALHGGPCNINIASSKRVQHARTLRGVRVQI